MKKVYLCVLASALLFCTMEVVLKICGNSLDNFQLTCLRFFVAGLLLLPMGIRELKENQYRLTVRDFLYMLVLGILVIPLSMLFFQIGVMNCNASTASVMIGINPVFTMVWAALFIGERITRRKALSLTIGMIGIIMMIRPWDVQEGNSVWGLTCMVLAAVFFGLYTVFGKSGTHRIGIFAQTSISFIEGSLVLLIIMLIFNKPVVAGVAENWLIVAYISVFVTAAGYLCYFIAVKYGNASIASITFFIKPGIAPFVALVVLHDHIMWNSYIGIACILCASFILMLKDRGAENKEIQEEN